jgi:hypothetical protein
MFVAWHILFRKPSQEYFWRFVPSEYFETKILRLNTIWRRLISEIASWPLLFFGGIYRYLLCHVTRNINSDRTLRTQDWDSWTNHCGIPATGLSLFSITSFARRKLHNTEEEKPGTQSRPHRHHARPIEHLSEHIERMNYPLMTCTFSKDETIMIFSQTNEFLGENGKLELRSYHVMYPMEGYRKTIGAFNIHQFQQKQTKLLSLI